ncbi:MAG: NTP transferase domain-containing protein, partial [bacterium]
MKAIILAAGYNRRLKDVIDIPKCLIKVRDRTLLERQIDALMGTGLKKEDIFIVAGYRHEMIETRHKNVILNQKFVEF